MLFRTTQTTRPASRPANEPEVLTLDTRSGPVTVALRRNPRARRYTLRVRTAERDVVLTMPQRGSLVEARAFALRYSEWLEVRLARLPQMVHLVPDALVPLRGEPHLIVHRPGARGTVWREEPAGTPLLCVAGDVAHVGRRVLDYLKREARTDLLAATRKHAGILDVTISRVTLRDTASRWGSCSSTGALSYSWRLILAPAWVLDYLAAHEVAHRVEMNHGPRFWRTVDRLYPDRRRAEAWLKAHGAELHRYEA